MAQSIAVVESVLPLLRGASIAYKKVDSLLRGSEIFTRGTKPSYVAEKGGLPIPLPPRVRTRSRSPRCKGLIGGRRRQFPFRVSIRVARVHAIGELRTLYLRRNELTFPDRRLLLERDTQGDWLDRMHGGRVTDLAAITAARFAEPF